MSNVRELVNLLQERPGRPMTIEQISDATGLKNSQISSAMNQITKKDLGIRRHAPKGVPMNGVYVFDPDPAPQITVAATPVKVPPVPVLVEYLMVKIVATTAEGWQVGIEEDSGRAYRIEKL